MIDRTYRLSWKFVTISRLDVAILIRSLLRINFSNNEILTFINDMKFRDTIESIQEMMGR